MGHISIDLLYQYNFTGYEPRFLGESEGLCCWRLARSRTSEFVYTRRANVEINNTIHIFGPFATENGGVAAPTKCVGVLFPSVLFKLPFQLSGRMSTSI